MTAPSPLDRFVQAQEGHWQAAMDEIRSGRKQTHWMWFVFPQLRGLGTSLKSRRYGIADLAEAESFAQHPVLGPRLRQAIQAVLDSPTRDLNQLFGPTDAAKFLSCLTLFESIPDMTHLCRSVLEARYGGQKDMRTLELLRAPQPSTGAGGASG
ncbi:MAG: DUF1810 family protein [Betaproteobacteria bacterium]|nr:DUF1810 family protein [Betaproteobacteria bacterium]